MEDEGQKKLSLRTLMPIVAALLLAVAGCGLKMRVFGQKPEGSNMRLVAKFDEHKTVDIPLNHDPSLTSLFNMAWSPGGRTLAFLDGNVLHTWHPFQSTPLGNDGGMPWSHPRWSPDGLFITVSNGNKTVIVDFHSMAITRELPGDLIVWWSDQRLCYADRRDPGAHSADESQAFNFGDDKVVLPTGMSLVAASQSGATVLTQTNFKGQNPNTSTFMLIGMDTTSGRVLWQRAVSTVRAEGIGAPDLLWNERLQVAAHTSDAGGGYDYRGFVDTRDHDRLLAADENASYNWISGSPNWVGDELVAPMTSATIDRAQHAANINFGDRILFYNAKAGTTRTLALGMNYDVATACDQFLAVVRHVDSQVVLTIMPWKKDRNGVIQGAELPESKQPTAQQV